jgi:hypothetical protein
MRYNPAMALRTIEQKITATNQFDGAAPAGAVTRAYDMERYPTGTVGGLFDFANAGPVQVKQIFIKLGGQSSWTLEMVDADAVATVVLSGTTETFVANMTLNLFLLQGQKLKLVTVAATTAMVARVTVDTTP